MLIPRSSAATTIHPTIAFFTAASCPLAWQATCPCGSPVTAMSYGCHRVAMGNPLLTTTVNEGREEVVIAAVVPGRDSADMARYVAWVFAALLLVPATGSAEGLCDRGQNQGKPGSPAGQTDAKPDQGHPPKWWVDPKLRNELGITDQQSTAIEA